jgi:ATP-dependent metalloprotease
MKNGPRQSQFEPTEGTTVTFSDVHGVDEAKEVLFLVDSLNGINLGYQELQDVVSFLKDPASFATLGGKLPKGVLLTGLDFFILCASIH